MSELKTGQECFGWNDNPIYAIKGFFMRKTDAGFILCAENSGFETYVKNVSHEKPQPKPVFEVGEVVMFGSNYCMVTGIDKNPKHPYPAIISDLNTGNSISVPHSDLRKPTQEELTALAEREIKPGYLYRYLIDGELVDFICVSDGEIVSFIRANDFMVFYAVMDGTFRGDNNTVLKKEKIIHTNKKVVIS